MSMSPTLDARGDGGAVRRGSVGRTWGGESDARGVRGSRGAMEDILWQFGKTSGAVGEGDIL